jgi:NAD(P)-dependent dehydrogenase (short-subunit alcohol dehydrogenase family)
MTSDLTLSGRRVVITGAGRGLGRALAITAADHGADPVLLGRNLAALQAVADAIRSRTGRDASVVACDLAQPDSIKEACRIVLATAPVIDVLVNNGAPWLPGSIMELTEAEIVATVAASVSGTILVTKGLLPGLMQSNAADIVTIVSTAGWAGWDIGDASAVFHAAKHGQSGFSDRLRHELKGQGIRVAAIYPPDFDNVDPLEPDWYDALGLAARGKLTNREVVATVLFAITAPRACAHPVIILDNMPPK